MIGYDVDAMKRKWFHKGYEQAKYEGAGHDEVEQLRRQIASYEKEITYYEQQIEAAREVNAMLMVHDPLIFVSKSVTNKTVR